MTKDFRKWRRNPKYRTQLQINEALGRGEANIYGVHQVDHGTQTGLRPVYGPPTIDQLYPHYYDYGPQYELESHTSTTKNYLNNLGYFYIDEIAKGEKPFDHQIWRVNNANNEQFACKVVSIRYFYEDPSSTQITSQVLAKMGKESEVLQECDHDNIIRIFDVIRIKDGVTDFEQVFLATIMELMGDSIESMYKRFINENGFAFPPELVLDMTCQIIPAVDYIHNKMSKYVCVHQAIRPANILYREIENGRLLYKLADFEEYFTFSKAEYAKRIKDLPKGEQAFPIDILQDYQGVRLYRTHWSSPEVMNAHSYHNLRLMPNDVYSLGASVIWLIAGMARDGTQWLPSFLEDLHDGVILVKPQMEYFYPQFLQLLRLMTDVNPLQRITAEGLMNHQHFAYLKQI